MINCKKQLCLFSGKLAQLEDAVVSASKTAFKLIDLRKHDGGHPRLGSVDLIPLHPITEDTSLEDCGEVARRIVTRLARMVRIILNLNAYSFCKSKMRNWVRP